MKFIDWYDHLKKRISTASGILIVCVVFVNAGNAQATLTGTLLGYDNKPLAKCVVLVTVGGPEEKTITIQPNEKGRFRHETNNKGLHKLLHD